MAGLQEADGIKSFLEDASLRILLIEDDTQLGDAIAAHITRLGHALDWVQDLRDGELALRSVAYDMLLLDLQLPDGLGLDLLRKLRARQNITPVIILTARDKIKDRIDGLNAGADDYIVKPFDLDELTARIGSIARRAAGVPQPIIELGDVQINCATKSVLKAGVNIAISAREWALLDALLRQPENTIPKSALEETLYAFGAEVESNAVEVYISRLRAKLGKAIIETRRGFGYRLGAGA